MQSKESRFLAPRTWRLVPRERKNGAIVVLPSIRLNFASIDEVLINIVYVGTRKNDLKCNPTIKTEVIHFYSRFTASDSISHLRVRTAIIKPENEVRDLGITLDSTLTLRKRGCTTGGGAPLRNRRNQEPPGVTNTNKPHIFFCRIPVLLESLRSSQEGVCTPCTLPLDPPLL